MKNHNIYTISFRRKRQGRTNYRKRLKILLSNKLRLVVRKSLKNFQASVIEYDQKGDRILFMVSSNTLSKLGWSYESANLPSAYLVGLLAGKEAIKKGIHEVILDIGFNKSTKGSSLYAALAGAIDAGLKIPFDPEVLPPKDRIAGEHIAKYAHSLKNNAQKYNRQFSNYIKKGLNPEDIARHFNEVKNKING